MPGDREGAARSSRSFVCPIGIGSFFGVRTAGTCVARSKDVRQSFPLNADAAAGNRDGKAGGSGGSVACGTVSERAFRGSKTRGAWIGLLILAYWNRPWRGIGAGLWSAGWRSAFDWTFPGAGDWRVRLRADALLRRGLGGPELAAHCPQVFGGSRSPGAGGEIARSTPELGGGGLPKTADAPFVVAHRRDATCPCRNRKPTRLSGLPCRMPVESEVHGRTSWELFERSSPDAHERPRFTTDDGWHAPEVRSAPRLVSPDRTGDLAGGRGSWGLGLRVRKARRLRARCS